MKYRIKEILESIDEDDLYKMQSDLSNGGIFLKKLVDLKLKQLEATKKGFCTTCGEQLVSKYTTYTVIWGPEDFKKKASFCEMDCLEYFLAGLRKINNRINEQESRVNENEDGEFENGI